ncbi:MAG: hypothetical protein AVDCRST_MAG11-2341, partial [uncultured Gemmatimonadaceae bacterium]
WPSRSTARGGASTGRRSSAASLRTRSWCARTRSSGC